MGYSRQPNTRRWTNVNSDSQDNQPVGAFNRWGLPDLVPTPSRSPKGSGQKYSYGLFGQQPQDDNGMHEGRQRYTYIPSTSSISPGRNPQPPLAQVPEIPFWPTVVPPPGSYIHPSDQNSYNSYKAWTAPPTLSPADKDSSSSIGSVSDDAPPTMYTSVNPFKSKVRRNSLPIAVDPFEKHSAAETPEYVVYPYSHRRTICLAMLVDFLNLTFNFFYEYLPRQVYLHFLLRLPAFYWSRVARIFEEAEMTMPEIEKMALHAMGSITIQQLQLTSPAGANLKVTWESFIDSLLKEWKTLNIVSVLLLSAILTLLQIDAASSDPITRNCALISLICALMSLLYGCMYIIRFASMRKTYKALEWAQMAQKTKTFIWWNVWVLLALPAVWLAWSIVLYITCIMAFVWRSGTSGLESTLVLSNRAELAIRITISVIFGIGVLYFGLIMNTLRRYGDSMDKQFKKGLDRLVRERQQGRPSYSYKKADDNYKTTDSDYHTPYYRETSAPGSFSLVQQNEPRWFKRAKVMDFRFQTRVSEALPYYLVERGLTNEKWERFISEAYSAWNRISPISGPFNVGSDHPRPQDTVAQLLERWNRKYFQPRSTLGVLCHEYIDLFPDSPSFAIYIVDVTPTDNEPILIAERFGPVPQGLSRIDIFDQPGHSGRSTRRILGRTSIFLTQNPMDGRVRFPYRQEDHVTPSDPDSTGNYIQTQPTSISDWSHTAHSHTPDIPIAAYSPSSFDGGSPPPSGGSPSRIPRTRSESPPRVPIINNHLHPSTPVQPTVNPDQSQHNLVTPIPRLSVPPTYYHVPSGSTSGSVWGGPSRPPSLYPDPEPFNTYGWSSNPTPATQKRRSRTLSPPRQVSRNSNRFPLPTVSPDYPWSTRQNLVPPTPNTNRTMTTSALSDLEILMPPVVHNQWPGWTPGPYQYQPSLPWTPWSYEPRPELMDMVNDSNTQSGQPPTSNVQSLRAHRRTRRASQSQEFSITQMGTNPPLATDSSLCLQPQPSPGIYAEGSALLLPHEPSPGVSAEVSNHYDVNARRRSTSTSYRSFSSSPPRDQDIPLFPVDLLRPSSPIQSGAEDGQQIGGMSNDEAPHRGRDHTPRSERTRVDPQALVDTTRAGRPSSVQASWRPDTVHGSIDNTVTGPWTMDHLSLRTILNP